MPGYQEYENPSRRVRGVQVSEYGLVVVYYSRLVDILTFGRFGLAGRHFARGVRPLAGVVAHETVTRTRADSLEEWAAACDLRQGGKVFQQPSRRSIVGLWLASAVPVVAVHQ